jgi:hypothetical protein
VTDLHPRAAVLEPVCARTSDEAEEHIGTAVLVLRVRRLDAELVRMCPGRTTRRALMVREPREEPVVRAVLVVDFKCDEKTSAEGDRGKDRTATEGGYADSDALFMWGWYPRHMRVWNRFCSPSSQSQPGSMGYAWHSKQKGTLTEWFTHLSATKEPRREEPSDEGSIVEVRVIREREARPAGAVHSNKFHSITHLLNQTTSPVCDLPKRTSNV